MGQFQKLEVNRTIGRPFQFCTSCGDAMIAATSSTYVNERCVRNSWSCDLCGFGASSLLAASVSRSCHNRPLNSTGSYARKFALRQHGFELPLHPFKVTTQLRGNGMMRKVRTVHVPG
jgi:hypothetical protein